MSILDDVYAILYQLANYIAELMYDFVNWMTSALSSILTWIQNAWNTAMKAINDTLLAIRQMVDAMLDGLAVFLQQLVDGITQAFATAWNIVKDAIVDAMEAISAWVVSLITHVRTLITNVIDQVKFLFTQFVDAVNSLVATVVDGVVAAYNFAVEKITEGVTTIVNFASDVLQGWQSTVQQALAGLITGPAAVFEQLSTRFNDIAGAFREKLTEVINTLGQFPDAVKETIETAIDRLLTGLLDWSNAPEMALTMGFLTELTKTGGSQQSYQQVIDRLFSWVRPESTLGRGVVFIFLLAAAAIPAVLNVSTIYAQPMIQSIAREFPYALLSPPDVVTAWRKGLVTQAEATDILKRQGYSAADALNFFGLSEAVPPEDIALALWHRDLVTEQQLDEALHERGFTAIWRERYKQASFVIPPIQDLITMAVREVFTPEAVAEFGLFQEFPQDFAEYAKLQGLSEDWAMRYWGAHWGLPSAMQGFEMLHRGVINEDRLKFLLRALDVMPGWRDPLIQIAYSPYTRVDIRRMHQLGVLSDDEVYKAHLELGYNAEKADKLSQFVFKLNRNAPGEDDAELGKLSRSSILGFYSDGLIDRNRASQLLVTLGLTPEASNIYLDSVDFDQERSERKAETDLVIAQAEAGIITFGEAQDRLGAIGLETVEVEKALARLARSEKSRTKLPSREDGERFLRLGLINGAQYKDLLLRLGYSPLWADVYVAAVLREGSNA